MKREEFGGLLEEREDIVYFRMNVSAASKR